MHGNCAVALLGLVLAGLSPYGMSLVCAADSRPNIVIILADDMGYSDAGCYGGEIQTPNLNRLAENGVRFSQFYNCSRCCPTRASLLTGAYPHRVGLANNGRTMSTDAPTVADRLKKAGYETAMTGKWHLSKLAQTGPDQDRIGWLNHQVGLGIPFADPSTYPINRGFERYYGVIWGVADYFDPFSLTEGAQPVSAVPDDYYITDAITDYTIRFIEAFAKTDKPFFLYVAYTAPHWPLHARPEDIAKYKGKYDAGWDTLRKERFQRQVELGLFDVAMPLGNVITQGAGWDDLSSQQQQYEAAKMEVHAAMVDRMDQGVGRILEALDQTEQWDNTLLLFLSDNGASPEIPGYAGYDRNGKTRDGRIALREKELRIESNRTKLGSDESYTGLGPAWASAANTPLRYWKKESYDGGCRTPLIVHWPAGLKAQRGSILPDIGHVMDITPTCLDVAGVKPTGMFTMDGQSLTPVLRGDHRDGHKALYFSHEKGRAVRQGNWKISALAHHEWEIFNVIADPGETNDLSHEQPEILKSMIDAWHNWRQRVELNVLN